MRWFRWRRCHNADGGFIHLKITSEGVVLVGIHYSLKSRKDDTNRDGSDHEVDHNLTVKFEFSTDSLRLFWVTIGDHGQFYKVGDSNYELNLKVAKSTRSVIAAISGNNHE